MRETKGRDELTLEKPQHLSALSSEDREASQRLADNAETILLACQQKSLGCPPDVAMHTFLGMPLAGLNTIEQTAVMYYRVHDFKNARRLFRLTLGLSELCGLKRPTALRGLAACDQSENDFAGAAGLYRQALAIDSHDEVSLRALADCLEHIGPDKWTSSTKRRDDRA